jgi:hypothetical protein
MSQKDRQWLVRIAAVALLLFAVAAVAVSFRVGQTRAAPSLSSSLVVTVLPVDCPDSSANIGSTFVKIADIGEIEAQSADSLVELAFHGRIYADTMTGNGVLFEMRVDDTDSGVGRIRALLRSDEVTNAGGVTASMGGVFEGLPAGTHMVSMWAMATNSGTATGVQMDPGCFSSDHVLVKEHLPFGAVAIPAVLRD